MQQYVEYEKEIIKPENLLFYLLQKLNNSSLNISIENNIWAETDEWVIACVGRSYFTSARSTDRKYVRGCVSEAITEKYKDYDSVLITRIEKHPYEIKMSILGFNKNI